ncbi:MAG: helix-turn-helix domain-containing protein [Solirubrobacteraceae bacterium]
MPSFLAIPANSILHEPIDARVRRRLRELRAEQGLTLAQVAARAAIDVSTLSRLESGKRRMALDHIPALAGALGVTADDLLGAPAAQDPRVRGRPQRHAGLTIWPLTRRGTSGLHAHRVLVSSRRRVPPDPLPVHEGHDWIYVLQGRMRLLLGESDLVIAPGEAVEFTTWTPHWFGAVEEAVELILILGPEGAHEHLHND